MNRRRLLKAIAGLGAAAAAVPLLPACREQPSVGRPATFSRGAVYPTAARAGDFYVSTTTNQVYLWDGVAWTPTHALLRASGPASSVSLPGP